jgi:hypothetical protein
MFDIPSAEILKALSVFSLDIVQYIIVFSSSRELSRSRLMFLSDVSARNKSHLSFFKPLNHPI